MTEGIKFTFKSLQFLPTPNRDPKKYNAQKQKLGIIFLITEVQDTIFIWLVCIKMEKTAREWIAMWMVSFPRVGDPPVVQPPQEAMSWKPFLTMLDQKFIFENVVRCYKENCWNCKQGTADSICNFISCFNRLRMLNLMVGTQAEAFKAAEKAVDILGKGNFPLLPNRQHLKKNGKNNLSGHFPTVMTIRLSR